MIAQKAIVYCAKIFQSAEKFPNFLGLAVAQAKCQFIKAVSPAKNIRGDHP